MIQAEVIKNKRQICTEHTEYCEWRPIRRAQDSNCLANTTRPDKISGKYCKRYRENSPRATMWRRILESENEYCLGQSGKQTSTYTHRRNYTRTDVINPCKQHDTKKYDCDRGPLQRRGTFEP